jgi:hypothetical protein
VDYLASRPAASLRELHQMVQRVVTAADERDVPLTVVTARRLLEGEPIEATRAPRRGSGLLAPGSGSLRSREKMTETWPDVGERLIEEWS